MRIFSSLRQGFSRLALPMKLALAALVAYALVVLFLMLWWGNHYPDSFEVVPSARSHAESKGHRLVTGYVTSHTLRQVADTLLSKRGGYLSNDMFPPGLLVDNVPNWEWGVVQQVRDLARVMRNDFARSQTQSVDDPDLREADPLFHFQNDSWILPSTEGEYRRAIRHLDSYLGRLANPSEPRAQFYARADNLATWLGLVSNRLGSLSQRLSASVSRPRLNTDLAGDPGADQSTPGGGMQVVKTPWTEIDDVFYEARGTCWALIQFLHAVEHDFAPVLERKNALVSLRQITRELEATQGTVWSPMILNGSGFGMTANHSLVMANYVSRANAAIMDLRRLLTEG